MQKHLPLFLTLFLLQCGEDAPVTQVISDNISSFTLNVMDDEAGRALFTSGSVHGDRCEAELAKVGGRDAIKLSTVSEFSDVFIDLEKLFGQAINFREASYFYFDAYVPEGSWIASIKFNHKGTTGNFGGCGNSANNLADHQGKWFTVEVLIEDWLPLCKNWSGDGDVLASTSEFTINPYNANRVETGVVYLNNLRLTKEKLNVSTLNPRLIDKPYVAVNSPYTITWDDQDLLNKQLAWRSFEATTQHITAGKFGNSTKAIRSYGTGQNKYICLLPDIEQMTGHPVNFHELDSLHFRYYLTPESATVGGATLFITTGDDWDAILVDTNFMSAEDFQRGKWTYFSAAIKDLNLEQAREEADVLAAVYEFRLDLHYEADAGPIEIWYDDFGWK